MNRIPYKAPITYNINKETPTLFSHNNTTNVMFEFKQKKEYLAAQLIMEREKNPNYELME